MGLGRKKVDDEVAERHAADKDVAATLQDRLTAAEEAGRALDAMRLEGGSPARSRELAEAYERALMEAVRAAEAGERVAMGPKTYEHGDATQRRAAQIAARKTKAKSAVRPWTDEVDRLRTLREAHKLSYRPANPSVA
jgi:hypothetical protein